MRNVHLLVLSQLRYAKKKEEKKEKTTPPDLNMEVKVRTRGREEEPYKELGWKLMCCDSAP